MALMRYEKKRDSENHRLSPKLYNTILLQDHVTKRTSHLVPYETVDERIKLANKATACEIVRTLVMYGYSIEAPTIEHDERKLVRQIYSTVILNF